MAAVNAFVLEVGRPGSQQLWTQIVPKGGLMSALPGERPSVLLAYTPKASSRAQKLRLRVLENLSRSRATVGRSATGMHVTVVRLSKLGWQSEVEEHVRTLRTTDVLCFIDSGAGAKSPTRQRPIANGTSSQSGTSNGALVAARARRDGMLGLGRWYTAPEVARLVNGEVARSNPSQYASTLRRKRRLLGVLHKGEYLHPEFQFDSRTGALRRETAELLRILPKDAAGWGAALWCFQPTKRLGGRRPADAFATDAKAVIAAAKRDFEGDDGNW